MKKKYKICLIIVGILLTLTLMIGTTYGLYISINKDKSKDSTILECFKIYQVRNAPNIHKQRHNYCPPIALSYKRKRCYK